MNSSSKQLIIFGAGGHAKSVANVALAMGLNIFCFVDERREEKKICDFNIVKDLDNIKKNIVHSSETFIEEWSDDDE